MKLNNSTKNQHFVSQAELRLNTSSPSEVKSENQKIYAFDILNPEQYKIALNGVNGKSIAKTLSLTDLFSFDILDRTIRTNFESLFHSYENQITENTKSLLVKVAAGDNDLSTELDIIFRTKLLNSFRNPYCIEKTLNTIGKLGHYEPTDPVLLAAYARIRSGRRPQQKHLCRLLGITDDLYARWLEVLFMLLVSIEPAPQNMLESIVSSLYSNPSQHLAVFVCTYDDQHSDKRPLLSDRSFCLLRNDDSCLAFSFNLCSSAFVSYMFTNVAKQQFLKVSTDAIETFRAAPRQFNITPLRNNLEALANFNRNTIHQAKLRVYSSSKTVYGANVQPDNS